MSTIAPRRLLCADCGLPLSTCLCAHVVPVDHRIAVLVLQHPREAREAKGSVRLLARCLAHCRVEVGESFDAAHLHALLHGEGRRSGLLYPDVASSPAPAGFSAEGIDQLVVLDATWRKSLKMLLSHPALMALPRVALDAPSSSEPGQYAAWRKAPRPGQRSTLEAVSLALAALDPSATGLPALREAFGRVVSEGVARRRPHGSGN